MVTIVIFVFLLGMSAFFSATETSFFSLSHARVRMMMDQKLCGADVIHRLKSKPRRLLIAILLGNNIVNISIASFATVIATRYFDSGVMGIATGASTVMILMFGEVFPKSLAIAKKERIALFVAWPMQIVYVILYPIVLVVHGISVVAYRVVGVSQTQDHVTEEEIRVMTRMGVEHGAVHHREHAMIENVFEFDDICVKDTMTPFARVESISATVPVEQIAFTIGQIGHSRYPVYDGDKKDDFIGYVHINTILQKLNSDERNRPVGDFVLPLKFIDENITIERAFRRMINNYTHLFFVRDAQKNVTGIITLEDILEELVGEIVDETDRST